MRDLVREQRGQRRRLARAGADQQQGRLVLQQVEEGVGFELEAERVDRRQRFQALVVARRAVRLGAYRRGALATPGAAFRTSALSATGAAEMRLGPALAMVAAFAAHPRISPALRARLVAAIRRWLRRSIGSGRSWFRQRRAFSS